jgi:NitT/TauT family transport system substrate-binding protein
LRVGLLPIADTILLHIALKNGYFGQKGLMVQLIPFQSTLEKDSAVLAGRLDGHFCEISSAMVLRSQDHPYKVIASTSHTNPKARFFGLVSKPDSTVKTLAEARDQSLGVARQTIVDFLADIFLERAHLPANHFQRRDIRKIPLRLQTLKAGQLDFSIFPEPLLSVAEKAGGRILADDRDLNMPLAAVALRDDLAPKVAPAFRAALAQAVAYANANPAPTRDLMLEMGLIPKALAEDWSPPSYDPALVPYRLPDEKLFADYVAWLVRNGVLRRPEDPGSLRIPPTYEETVDQISPEELSQIAKQKDSSAP